VLLGEEKPRPGVSLGHVQHGRFVILIGRHPILDRAR
jgi:hypothetical protein